MPSFSYRSAASGATGSLPVPVGGWPTVLSAAHVAAGAMPVMVSVIPAFTAADVEFVKVMRQGASHLVQLIHVSLHDAFLSRCKLHSIWESACDEDDLFTIFRIVHEVRRGAAVDPFESQREFQERMSDWKIVGDDFVSFETTVRHVLEMGSSDGCDLPSDKVLVGMLIQRLNDSGSIGRSICDNWNLNPTIRDRLTTSDLFFDSTRGLFESLAARAARDKVVLAASLPKCSVCSHQGLDAAHPPAYCPILKGFIKAEGAKTEAAKVRRKQPDTSAPRQTQPLAPPPLADQKVCWKCSQPGHVRRNCPNPPVPTMPVPVKTVLAMGALSMGAAKVCLGGYGFGSDLGDFAEVSHALVLALKNSASKLVVSVATAAATAVVVPALCAWSRLETLPETWSFWDSMLAARFWLLLVVVFLFALSFLDNSLVVGTSAPGVLLATAQRACVFTGLASTPFLDSGSQLTLAGSGQGLFNLRRYDGPKIVTATPGGDARATWLGDHPVFGETVVLEGSPHSVISFSMLKKTGWTLNSASASEFVLSNHSWTVTFSESQGLYPITALTPLNPIPVSATSSSTVLSVTASAHIDKVLETFVFPQPLDASTRELAITPSELRLLKWAHVIHVGSGHQSVQASLDLSRSIAIHGNVLTPRDFANAVAYFGPCAACLEGKMVAKSVRGSLVRSVEDYGFRWHLDIVNIGSVQSLLAVEDRSRFKVSVRLFGKGKVEVCKGLDWVVLFSKGFGYVVSWFSSDNEEIFRLCADHMRSQGIQLWQSGSGDHEKVAESTFGRAICPQWRATKAGLWFSLPRALHRLLYEFVLMCSNMVGNSQTGPMYSPVYLFCGLKLPMSVFEIGFGALGIFYDSYSTQDKLAARGHRGIVVFRDLTNLSRFGIFMITGPYAGQVVVRSHHVWVKPDVSDREYFQAMCDAELQHPKDASELSLSRSVLGRPFESPDPEQVSAMLPVDGSDDDSVTSVQPTLPAAVDPAAILGVLPPQAVDPAAISGVLPPQVPVPVVGPQAALTSGVQRPARSHRVPDHLKDFVMVTSVEDVGALLASDPQQAIVMVSIKSSLITSPELTRAALAEEMLFMISHRVFAFVHRRQLSALQRASIIPSLFVVKETFGQFNGTIDKVKVRLVASGNLQKDDTFYNTASANVDITSLFLILITSAYEGRYLATVDVTKAFLNARVDSDQIYVKLPPVALGPVLELYPLLSEFVQSDGSAIVHLKKNLYGIRQGPFLFFNFLSKVHENDGLIKSRTAPAVFHNAGAPVERNGEPIVWPPAPASLVAADYSDDILVSGDSLRRVDGHIAHLTSSIETGVKVKHFTPGAPVKYLAMEIRQSSNRHVIVVSQISYVLELCLNFFQWKKSVGLFPGDESVFSSSPADQSILLEPTPDVVHLAEFRSLVARLNFLSSRSRPDIRFAVVALASFQSSPDLSKWAAMFRLIKFLNKTSFYVLRFAPVSTQLEVYCDSSHASWWNGYAQSGVCLVVGGALLQLESSKQTVIASSSAQAEMAALAKGANYVTWARDSLSEKGYPQDVTTLWQDNMATLTIATNGFITKNSARHWIPKFFSVKSLVDENVVELKYLPTASMLADGATKALAPADFARWQKALGVVDFQSLNSELAPLP